MSEHNDLGTVFEMFSGQGYDAERDRIEKIRETEYRSEAKQSHKGPGYVPAHLRPFVMWDGEATQDKGYCLFGSSAGDEICKPFLTTEDCFDVLLKAKKRMPDTTFMIFGGRYDFDEIIRQSVPENRLRSIKRGNRVYWHGYWIKEIPGKKFTVTKKGTTVTVYEAFGWFHSSYVKAMIKYKIGPWAQPDDNSTAFIERIASQDVPLSVKILRIAHTLHDFDVTGYKHSNPVMPVDEYALRYVLTEAETVQLFKYQRGAFTWKEIELIRHYMHLELKYGPPLMNEVRKPILKAGFKISEWYGPSALSAELLKKHGITRTDCPEPVALAAQYAYAGGRFEMVRGGELSPVYSADMNSAYMTAALLLPDLRYGTWRQTDRFEPGKFGVYKIYYLALREKASVRASRIYPLFRRNKNGSVVWEDETLGWYWSPEAALVAGSDDAVFLDGWVFDEADPSLRPFAFVADVYRARRENPSAEKAFKWALASIYGHLARRIGWDERNRKPPRYHQLEWAGFITSWVRAEMYKAALSVGDKLISIDTDSVTAMCPIDVAYGPELGQWKESRSESGIFFQNGIYWLHNREQWFEGKSRGISEIRGIIPVSPDMLREAITQRKPLVMEKRPVYTTVRMALNGVGMAGHWITREPVKIHFGGGGKRIHGHCGYCTGNVHVFHQPPRNLRFRKASDRNVPYEEVDYESYPHRLPWVDGKDEDTEEKELAKVLIRDILWVDAERVDSDEYWIFGVGRPEDDTGG